MVGEAIGRGEGGLSGGGWELDMSISTCTRVSLILRAMSKVNRVYMVRDCEKQE